MELTLKLNIGDQPHMGLVNQLLTTAAALDQPPVLRRVSIGDISHTEYPANGDKAIQAFHEMTEAAEGAVGSDEGDTADQTENQVGTGTVTAAGQAAPAAPGKRGRPSKAEVEAKKAAEAAAAALVASTNAGMAPPQPTSVPQPTAAPTGVTLPPGVSAQQPTLMVVAANPAPVMTPVPAALPAVPPVAAQPTADGVVPLEVFREAYVSANTRFPGRPFVLLKSTTWPDGTPKQGWFTAEAVAPEFRERLLEIWSTLT